MELIRGTDYRDLIGVSGPRKVGKTLLATALGTHPRIVFEKTEGPLLDHIGTMVYSCLNSWRGSEGGYDGDPGRFERVIKTRPEYLYKTLRRLCFESVLGRHYGVKRLKRALISRDLSLLSKKNWCVEIGPDIQSCKGLMQLYPRARFMYIVRNGIDAVQGRSKWLRRTNAEIPFVAVCRDWVHRVEKYSKLYRSGVAPVLPVRFEELVLQPEDFFQKAFQFLGVDHHPGSAAFVNNKLGITTRDGIFGKSTWDSWDLEQRETFRMVCGDTMGQLNYELPSHSDSTVSWPRAPSGEQVQ